MKRMKTRRGWNGNKRRGVSGYLSFSSSPNVDRPSGRC
jgi:hypothetical protein